MVAASDGWCDDDVFRATHRSRPFVKGTPMRVTATRVLLAVSILCAAVAASAQTVDEIVEKSLTALGGRAALAKVTSRSTSGKMTVSTPGGDVSGTIEVLNQAPNKSRTLINLDLTPLGAQSLVVDNRFDALAGREKVADRDAYALTITPAAGPVTHLFIDAESYLPAKMVVTIELPEIGSVEQTIEFADYRDVDGVKVPFRLKGSSAVQTFFTVISKVEHNVKIDPALFVKPAVK